MGKKNDRAHNGNEQEKKRHLKNLRPGEKAQTEQLEISPPLKGKGYIIHMSPNFSTIPFIIHVNSGHPYYKRE